MSLAGLLPPHGQAAGLPGGPGITEPCSLEDGNASPPGAEGSNPREAEGRNPCETESGNEKVYVFGVGLCRC
jgi:hypothetical protein